MLRTPVHTLAIIFLVLAGAAYLGAGLARWRRLGNAEAPVEGRGEASRSAMWALAVAFTSLTAALVCALLEHGSRDFGYGVLGIWSAVAGLQFAAGLMTAPTRALLVLPVGAAALLLAVAGLAHHGQEEVGRDSLHVLTVLHSIAMAGYLAVGLVAGGAGGLFLLQQRALKRPTPRALRLPPLPVLSTLMERALIISAALLLSGLALGSVAIRHSDGVRLAHPSVVLALVNLALLTLAFFLRLSNRLSRRGIALAAVQTMALAALVAGALQVVPHGVYTRSAAAAPTTLGQP
jgi:hypothetical protein